MSLVNKNQISCVFATWIMVGSIFATMVGFVMFGTEDAAAVHTADGNTVALWHFDDGSGQVLSDSSGNGNNGTLGASSSVESSDPTWVDGMFGKALDFDGVNDYAKTDINFNTGFQDLTLEVWFKPRGIPSDYQSILGKTDGTGLPSDSIILIRQANNSIVVNIQVGSDTSGYISCGVSIVDNWNYVAVRRIGSTGLQETFLNGVKVTSAYQQSGSVNNQSRYLAFGRLGNFGGKYFNGTIDEISISNVARTASEISTYYNKSVTAGYWHFNEGSGQVAADSSGNGNDGQLGSTSSTDSSDPTWVDGISGKALQFDGVDDYVNCSQGNGNLDNMTELTIDAWVYPTSFPDDADSMIILGKLINDSDMSYNMEIDNPSRKLIVQLKIDNKPRIIKYFNTPIIINEWSYIAITWNGTVLNAFINGKKENDSVLISGNAVHSSSANLWIGRYEFAPINRFNGTIDEVRISNVARTASEISDHYNKSKFQSIIFEDFTGTNGSKPDSKIWTIYEDDGTARIQDNKLKLTPGTVWAGTGAFTTKTYPNTGIYTVESKVTIQKGTNNADVCALWITDPYYDRDDTNYYHYMGSYIDLFDARPSSGFFSFQYLKQVNGNYSTTWGENVHYGILASYTFGSNETFFVKASYNADTGDVSSEIYKGDHTLIVKRTGKASAGFINQLRDGLRFELHRDGYNANPAWWDYIYINWSGPQYPNLEIIKNNIDFSNSQPSPREEITISAKVQNTGTISGSAKVKFWDRDPQNINWIRNSENPVLTPGSSGAWDDTYVIPGTIIKDGNQYKMWYSGSPDGSGTNSEIGYATSTDGLSWTKYANNPVISPSDISWSVTICNNPSVIKENGTYKMWFSTWNNDPYRIAYAESSNGINWTVLSTPVLTPSVGEWDANSVGFPFVLKEDGLYKMWYAGKSQVGNKFRIGYAFSSNGKNWTKYSNNPVLTNGSSGEWDDIYVLGTTVFKQNDLYFIYYHGSNGETNIGSAVSFDGKTWEKIEDNPKITKSKSVDWDDSDVGWPAVLLNSSNNLLYYMGTGTGNLGSIGVLDFQQNATLIAEKTLTDLCAGQNTTISTTWQVPSVARNYTVFVTIEDVTPTDTDLSNNKAESANITVSGTSPNSPDLYISSSLIYLNKTSPTHGDTVRIYAKIWNNGLKDATSANVTFYDGDPAKGGAFIDNVISQFASGYQTVRFVDWKATAGTHTIYVLIKDVVPSDAKLSNNKAYIAVTVNQKPKLVKPVPDVKFDEDSFHSSQFTLNDHFSDTSYVGLGVGKDHTQLTTDNYAQRYPYFSPDGKTIAYDSMEDGGGYRDIWTMDTAGKNRVKLTTEDYHQEQPCYSPDGKYIVYTSYEAGTGYSDIWLMNANGTNHVRLTNESYNQSAPKFSPDGSTIVYYSKEDGGLYNDIWQLERNGASWDLSAVHTQLTADASTQYNPVFSPDGSRIAFEDDTGSPGTWNIYTMNTSGGDRKQLTTSGGRGPLYSPDGQVIIYFSQENVSAYWDVWLMTVDGSDKTQLTIEQADQLYGCFSPDGSKIAYDSNEDGGSYVDIWVMNFYKDTLTYSVSGNTNIYLTINPDRTMGFSAKADWFGSEDITVRATDSYGFYAEDTFKATVLPVNDPPVVTDIPDVLFSEDQWDTDLDLDYFVTDIDNTKAELTWSYSGNTNVIVTIDAATNKVNFSAKQDWNGQETLTFTATDPGLLSDQDTVTVKVIKVNDAPAISNLPDIEFDEDGSHSTLDLDDYVSDPDNSDAVLSWQVLNNGEVKIAIDGATHLVTFTAKADWYGKKNVSFKVTDPGSLWDVATITVTVRPVNDRPTVIGPLKDFSMKEDTVDNTTIDLSSVFFDVDGDKLTYSISGDTNIKVTINTNGKVKLEPNKDWNGEEILVFSATDGKSAAVTDTVKVNVTPVNDPSSMDGNGIQFAAGLQNLFEDVQLTFDISPYISDIDNDLSDLSVSENSPYVDVSGLSLVFDYPNGVTYDEVTITVSDGTDETSATIYLSITPVNDPPVLKQIDDITVKEGETIVLVPIATDVDNDHDELSFEITGDLNSTLWFTDYRDSGTYTANVTVTDGELSDYQLVTITVVDIPQPPVIEPIPVQDVNENDLLSVQVEGWDWDDDTLTYSLSSAPAGMTIDSTTGLISWQPSWQQVGDHYVSVKAFDGMFESEKSFKVTVINVNDPPVANVLYYTGVSAYDGEIVNFTLRISGTKYMAVTMSLYEDSVMVKRQSITRQPGNPDEQTCTIMTALDLGMDYSLSLEYIAEQLGATPVKLYIKYGENSAVLHYTFNAMHGEKKEVLYDINAIIENNPVNDKTVRLDASGSYDPDGSITKYFWDFGDGETSTNKMVTHIYKKIDWYKVTLTLTDNEDEKTVVEYQVNPSYSTVVLPVEGGTDVVDYEVTGEAQITAVYVSNPSTVTEGTIGLFVDYTLQGEGSLEWVNITIDYSDIILPEGTNENDLKLYWYDEVNEEWVLCENTGVDTEKKIVWANVTHFTVFAPMAKQAQKQETGPLKPELMLLPVIIGIVVFFILGILVTGGMVRSENAMAGLGKVAGKMISDTYKTDNELRGRILGMIEARPGVHYSWIKINIGKGNGVCAYHLNKLEKDDKIKAKKDGSFKRYYPIETTKNGESKPVLSDIQNQIIEIIQEHPGASQKEIGYLLDEKKAKINYHTKQLERKGVIRVSRDETGHTECYLVKETTHIPSPKKKKPKKSTDERDLKEIEEDKKKKEPAKKEFSERRQTKKLIKKYEGKKPVKKVKDRVIKWDDDDKIDWDEL